MEGEKIVKSRKNILTTRGYNVQINKNHICMWIHTHKNNYKIHTNALIMKTHIKKYKDENH